ncbi:hypothetical protein EBT16_00680 [bacterium]|nr:hypothetical protein [bacterium]
MPCGVKPEVHRQEQLLRVLAGCPAAGLSFLEEDSWGMQRMRPVDDCLSSLLSIMENPSSEGGYFRLKKCYDSRGMQEEAEAITLLIAEKFNADSSNTAEE